VVDAGIDAAGEGRRDSLGVGRIARPFGVHVAAIANQPGEAVGFQGVRPIEFGVFASREPTPQVELEQSILSGDKALGKKQIVRVIGVDVRYAPAIAQDFHRRLEPGQTDVAFELREHRFRFPQQLIRLVAGASHGCVR
jgi:hypothetical protein